jgi:hypothetical protein
LIDIAAGYSRPLRSVYIVECNKLHGNDNNNEPPGMPSFGYNLTLTNDITVVREIAVKCRQAEILPVEVIP